MSQKNLKSFLERAAECERRAKKAVDPKNREMFLYVASRWRNLAAEEEGARVSVAPRIPRLSVG